MVGRGRRRGEGRKEGRKEDVFLWLIGILYHQNKAVQSGDL